MTLKQLPPTDIFSAVAIAMALVAVAGCQNSSVQHEEAKASRYIPYVSAQELMANMAEKQGLVMVEFCVPVGCFRCDEMRPQINRLAGDKDEMVICRVDLNREPALATQFRVTMCPSYVVFNNGKELLRVVYPTSGDLILAELRNAMQPPLSIQ